MNNVKRMANQIDKNTRNNKSSSDLLYFTSFYMSKH